MNSLEVFNVMVVLGRVVPAHEKGGTTGGINHQRNGSIYYQSTSYDLESQCNFHITICLITSVAPVRVDSAIGLSSLAVGHFTPFHRSPTVTLSGLERRQARAGEKPIKLADVNGLYLEVGVSAARLWRQTCAPFPPRPTAALTLQQGRIEVRDPPSRFFSETHLDRNRLAVQNGFRLPARAPSGGWEFSPETGVLGTTTGRVRTVPRRPRVRSRAGRPGSRFGAPMQQPRALSHPGL